MVLQSNFTGIFRSIIFMHINCMSKIKNRFMKNRFILFLVLLTMGSVAQVQLPHYPDSLFSIYYHQRATLFTLLPKTKDDIIFIGNSITDGGEWSEMFNDLRIKNRGISSDISAAVLNRIAEVAKRKPAKVFLMLGVNDLARGISTDSVMIYTINFRAISKKQNR